jgi:proteasome lid subunit RPN8/RPN11
VSRIILYEQDRKIALESKFRLNLKQEDEMAIRSSRIPIRHSLEWIPRQKPEVLLDPLVQVFITQNAYIRICAHAGSDLENEVGGWMAGKYCQDATTKEQFIVIDTILAAPYTEQGAAHLTFTSNTQIALFDFLERYHPDKVLVGWYHTHPRMGVFFSSWDEWLHNNFFSKPWQVALVVEPFTSTGGFFIRQKNGVMDTRAYFGFHELINREKKSKVFWKNLEPKRNLNTLETEVLVI